MTVAGKAAIVGGGVIGGGWVARFLLHGWDVCVYDTDPEAGRKIGDVLDNARRALPLLADVAMPEEGSLTFAESIEIAVTDAEWIQESVPEQLDIKHRVFADIRRHMQPNAVVGSSTSCFTPSQLRGDDADFLNIIVAHPFNPVYLLPLVEVVQGEQFDANIIDRAQRILTGIGMKALIVRKEIDGHIADRLLEAVWREGLWLINDGVATTEEIDDAIRFGFGLRWAQMGLFETYRIAGGEAGMLHFIAQFGPTLSWPVSKLMDVPDLTDELIQTISEQSDTQSGHHSIRELERIRDDNLVGMLRALKDRQWGAGELLHQHDKHLQSRAVADVKPSQLQAAGSELLQTYTGSVLPSWIDYNGHMTESRYLMVCSDACDALLALIGAGMEYVAAGHSYYTAETHIMHKDEAKLGETLQATTQVLSVDSRRLHVFHTLHAVTQDGESRVVATGEQMCLHVDTRAGKVCPASAEVLKALEPIVKSHATLPLPADAGRCISKDH